MRLHIGIRSDHEAKSAARWIVAQLARLRRDQPCHHTDQHTGRKILSSAGFLLIGVLFQETLIQVAQALFLRREPVELVDGLDDLLKIFGLIDIRLCSLIDFTHTASTVFTEI